MTDEAGADSAEIQAIYREVQELYRVPYVSAIHKSLARQPGFLEWAWHEVAPAFRTGAAQDAAWAAAAHVKPEPLDPIPREALRAWGLKPVDVATVRAAAETFLRVSPVNMMFAALLKLRLDGVAPSSGDDAASTRRWDPPAVLAATTPPMVDVERCDGELRELGLLFASERDGAAFVPGLYCMLLNWPGLAAHLGTVLVPRMRGEVRACDGLRQRIDEAAPGVLMGAANSPFAAPSAAARADFARAAATYRQTSPELVVSGRLMLAALPVD